MPLGTLIQFMLPRWFVIRLAPLIGRIFYWASPRSRQQLLENCRHILGQEVSSAELHRVVLFTMVNFVRNYLDLLRVPVMKHRVAGIAQFDPANLDRVMASGRGAILVTAHLGNWDLGGVFLTALGYPVSAVVEPIPRGWTRTFNRYRSALAMETIEIPDHQAIARALEAGRLLALVADRDLTNRGILCPAFDAQRSFPRGPAAYALRYNLPVVLGYFVFQDRPGRPPYLAVVEPPLKFQPTGNLDQDIIDFTRLIAARLNE
ncbi:MAG: lysophospholipid acyltransferase family protein, partial [candidate division WOR-3 bacterium]